MSHCSAIQNHLCLCDFDDSITSSLKADTESLLGEIQQLEQAWKQSLLTSATARCHSDKSTVYQLSVNCASDETGNAGVSECHCDGPNQVDKCGLSWTESETRRCLDTTLDSECCDSVIHKTVQTYTCPHAYRELTMNDRAMKPGTSLSVCDARSTDTAVQDCTSTTCDVCPEFVMSAKVDAFFTDQLQLARYESCCSKLEELFSVFLSVNK